MAVVLHPLQQRLDRLRAEVLPCLGAGERVRLVDEEHAVERALHDSVGLDRGRADELADETGAVGFHEMAALQESHRAIHLGEQARDGRLAGSGVAEEHEVLARRDLREAVLLPACLHLEDRELVGQLVADGLPHALAERAQRVGRLLERIPPRHAWTVPARMGGAWCQTPKERLSAFVHTRPYGTRTSAPRTSPRRSLSSASFPCSSGNVSTCVRTGTCGASARNSSPSRRVRFATERTTRSPQSRSYGNDGMSDMWIPAQTTVPPFATAPSATGTRAPTGAKRIAASSSSGGRSSEPPAHSVPSSRAKFWASVSPGRVNANTRRPCARATCATMCADAPNP